MKTTGNHAKPDFVSAWFAHEKLTPPELGRETNFTFAAGDLRVTSNHEAVINPINQRLRHYRRRQEKNQNPAGPPVRAEIFYYRELPLGGGISLPPHRGGVPIDLETPGQCKVYSPGGFYHLALDGNEALWRPHDLLVSYAPGFGIRMVIVENPGSENIPPPTPVTDPGKQPLDRKGGIDWEEIADMVFMLFMRLNDLFCLHAASCILDGKGVVMIGESGSGKTTSALALARAGATLLSDEITLLSTSEKNTAIGGVILDPRLGLPPETSIYAPPTGEKVNNWEKTVFPLPQEHADAGIHRQAEPALLLFLDLKENNTGPHRVHEVDEHGALTGLISQVLDPTNSTRHQEIFDAVFHLVSNCKLYRLELGPKVENLPQFIAGLL